MDIFTVISDPTRREIISRLHHGGPQSIKQLCEGMSISRQGVTKHLDKLIKGKVVSAQFIGKQRVHSLQPEPMRVLLSWLAPFAKEWDTRLGKLSSYLGETGHE